jgi:hypothetical protein
MSEHGTGPGGRPLELTAQSNIRAGGGGGGFICHHMSFLRSALSVSSQMFVYNSFVLQLVLP